MRIKRYGHASFLIEGDNIRIVTDPYIPELIGYDPITEPADVVIMSSATDPAHNNAPMIPGSPTVIPVPPELYDELTTLAQELKMSNTLETL